MAFGSAIKKSNISENWLFDFYNQDSYLSFDGTNDYVDLGATTASSAIAIEGTSEDDGTGISIAFWINFPVIDVAEIIFTSHDTNSPYQGYWITKNASNYITFNWGEGSGTGGGNRESMTGDTALEADTWYFVVITSEFTYNTLSDTKIYIVNVNSTTSDGITNDGTGNVNTPAYGSGTSTIAREIFGDDGYGQFKLRNLGIWAGILATTDISVIYNSGKYYNFTEDSGNYASADVNKLKAYWQFNNAHVATDFINDQSGKIHGATYTGSELHLAFKDTSYNSNFYHGVIKNKPSIRESINLSNSRSSRSNLSLDIPDFKYKGSPISEELFGSNVYMNHDVRVYSQIDGVDTELIGTYRLSDISTDGNSVKLSLKSFHPWDNISIPQNKHLGYNVYEPVVYGNFTGAVNANTANDAYGVMGTVFPAPVLQTSSNYIWTLMPRSYVAGDNAYIHRHIEGFNAQFIPLRLHSTIFTNTSNRVDSATSTSLDDSGLNILSSRITAEHSGTWYESAFVGFITTAVTDPQFGGSVTYFDNMDNMFKWTPSNAVDDTVYASKAIDVSTQPAYYLMVQTPKKEFTLEYVHKFEARISVVDDDGSAVTASQQIQWDAFSNRFDPSADDLINQSSDANYKRYYNGSVGSGTEEYLTNSGGLAMTLTAGNNISGSSGGAMSPDNLLLKLYFQNFSGQEDHTCKIHSLKLLHANHIPIYDDNEDDQDDHEKLGEIKYFYSGGNGLQHGITGLSGTDIDEVHDAHLDLMNRFTGLDVASSPTSNIEGWSALNSAKDWKIRYWELEPVSLVKVLEKLQYEGGFIFTLRRGDLAQPEYIVIKDSYSESDIDFLNISKLDLKNVEIKPDSFSKIVTKMDVNYQKHPNPDKTKYLFLKNCENNSSKAEYVINSKENKVEVRLDAYVSPEIPAAPSSNPNDDFYTYYNNINGEVKLNISGTFVNPKYYSINVGNTVTFSDSLMYPEKAYGKAFTDVIFMITSITRSVGSIKFTAREIGSL